MVIFERRLWDCRRGTLTCRNVSAERPAENLESNLTKAGWAKLDHLELRQVAAATGRTIGSDNMPGGDYMIIQYTRMGCCETGGAGSFWTEYMYMFTNVLFPLDSVPSPCRFPMRPLGKKFVLLLKLVNPSCESGMSGNYA